ncbi:MAG: cytochrome c [Cocleimonas sp.]
MIQFQKLTSTLVTSLLLTVAGSAMADDGADAYTAKGCAACHGADAKSPIMPLYPKIAGQSKEYLTQQMADIKNGKRSNGMSGVMKGVMAGVSDDEITALAVYISGLK